MNYLVTSTRSDIAFAVHQCAQFLANAKLGHAMKGDILFVDLIKEMDGIFDSTCPKIDLHCILGSAIFVITLPGGQ